MRNNAEKRCFDAEWDPREEVPPGPGIVKRPSLKAVGEGMDRERVLAPGGRGPHARKARGGQRRDI